MADPQWEHRFTYADYRSWDKGERFELIHGVPYAMSPAPRVSHQMAVGEIYDLLMRFLEASDQRDSHVIVSPVDVRLFQQTETRDDETDTVVQPDVVVVCDPAQIDDKGILGPPTVVVEILSESTSYRDQSEKLALYDQAGVPEYWIVNGDGGWMMVYRRQESRHGRGEDGAAGTGTKTGAGHDRAGRFTKPDYYVAGDRAWTLISRETTFDPGRIFDAMKLPGR